MEQNLKQEEREVIKLIGFFKKRAEQMLEEKKLPEEYRQLIETADKLVDQINLHAHKRETVLSEREQLQNLVRDNAQCPKCASNEKLKLIGTDKNEQGWKSNKYKCRNCNIEFVWNAPNNPWDMIPYVEHIINKLRNDTKAELQDNDRKSIEAAIAQMEDNLAKLKPIIEASDLDMADLETRDKEMEELVHKFKKHLMIEKIRMED
ncbi:MAG TPA: hypothetical protein VN026_06140 [Bacteroidia bacterium]|jgi:hypothetical protein|nr:hypothetical protein [Bacteroidia bacterium]